MSGVIFNWPINEESAKSWGIKKTKDAMRAFVWLVCMFNYLTYDWTVQDEWKSTCCLHDPIWDVVICQCITKTTNKHLSVIWIRWCKFQCKICETNCNLLWCIFQCKIGFGHQWTIITTIFSSMLYWFISRSFGGVLDLYLEWESLSSLFFFFL